MRWRRWLIGTWDWKRPLKSLAFIYGCLLVVTVFFAEKLIFFPPVPGYEDREEPRGSFCLVSLVPVLFVISFIVPGVLLQWEILRETVWIDVR